MASRVSKNDVFRDFIRYRYTKRRMIWWKRMVRITMIVTLMKFPFHHRRRHLHRCLQKEGAGSAKQLSASARRRGRNCLLYRNKTNVTPEWWMRGC
jgi:hypothetical protein